MMTRSGGDRQPYEPDHAPRIFCLAVDQVHRLSHGLAADEVLEVGEGS